LRFMNKFCAALAAGGSLLTICSPGISQETAPPRESDRIEASRHGCLTPHVCILTLDDVKHLPDRNGSLGFKLVEGKPTFEIVNGRRKYQAFVMFAVFDLARGETPSPRLREGASIATINKYAFDSAAAIERYVRSLAPGTTISMNIAIADRSGMAATSERVTLPVMDTRAVRFATSFPVFLSQEQARRINR
jgi:hypothetical protein